MFKVLSFFLVQNPRACSSGVVSLDCMALIKHSMISVHMSAFAISDGSNFQMSGSLILDIALNVWVSR